MDEHGILQSYKLFDIQRKLQPEQPTQNAQKSPNPEYDVFASHN